MILFRCLGTRQLLDEEDECQPNGKMFKVNIVNVYKVQIKRVKAESKNFK